MSALVIPRHPDDALLDFSSPTIQLPLLIGNTPSTHADLSTETHGDLSTETHGDANSEHGEQWDNSPSLYTVQLLGCLTGNDHRNSVYVAALRISGGEGTNTENLVVCKVARGQDNFEELCREAKFYIEELRGLQGEVIPWFYGLFDGDVDGVHVGVAVLSYCGKPLSSTGQPFEAYSLDLRSQIYLAMLQIHEKKIRHNDLSERNVLCDHNGRIWIIDFGRSQPHPDRCRLLDIEASFVQNTVPRSDLVLCSEMHNLVEMLQAWYTPEYYGIRFSDFNNIPTTDQLTAAVAGRVDRNTASAEAMSLLHDFRCWLLERQRLAQQAPELEAKLKNDKYVRDALRGGVITL